MHIASHQADARDVDLGPVLHPSSFLVTTQAMQELTRHRKNDDAESVRGKRQGDRHNPGAHAVQLRKQASLAIWPWRTRTVRGWDIDRLRPMEFFFCMPYG